MANIYTKTLDKQEITSEDIAAEYERLSVKIILTGYNSLAAWEKIFCETLDKHYGTRIVPSANSFEGIESVVQMLKKEIGLTGG